MRGGYSVHRNIVLYPIGNKMTTPGTGPASRVRRAKTREGPKGNVSFGPFRYFMAALLMPVMMYFCRNRKSSTMGMMAITAPAMISL